MPKITLSKDENQPQITTLLKSSPVTINSDHLKLTEENEEVDKSEYQVVSKRKRKHRSSGSPKINPSKKLQTTTPPKMATPTVQPHQDHTTADMDESVQLSPELLELEKRLNQTMLANITKGIELVLKPIRDSIEKIMTSSELISKQEETIQDLTVENIALKKSVAELKTEISDIKSKLVKLENKSLERNLVFRGIEELQNETDISLIERLYWIIADTINAFEPAE